MVLDACRKKEVVESFKNHENDTGSPAVQIALITERIKYLAEHFKQHQKDFGSRRGLLKLVGQRRRLLDYLKTHQPLKYKEIVERLDLRK